MKSSGKNKNAAAEKPAAVFDVCRDTTLLIFLVEAFEKKSRNYVKGILGRGQVAIDGIPTTRHSAPLRRGQRVEVTYAAAPPLPVIYEDDDIIVVDKPAGMLSVSTDTEKERTAHHLLAAYIRSRNPGGRIFIVHRLDRETSGVLLFAKSEGIKRALQDNWADAAVYRGYTAVVEGRMEPPIGTMRSWLKQTKSLTVYSSFRPGDGQEAVTRYKTVRTGESHSLLEIALETGRKNQIRVHMKDAGHPVAGDRKYGAKTDPVRRVALHARLLVLRSPKSGQELRLEAPVPPSFNKIIKSAAPAKAAPMLGARK